MKIYEKLILLGMTIQVIGEGIQAYYNLKELLEDEWMAEPTLDELVAFMKKRGAEKVDSITDEKSAIKHFRATSRVYKEERDAYKKQRDELINDMAEIKKKAKAFDEIVKVLASISKEIVEYPGDNDKQKEVIYKRYDDLFEPMKLLEVNDER